jgi:hypothetical protein
VFALDDDAGGGIGPEARRDRHVARGAVRLEAGGLEQGEGCREAEVDAGPDVARDRRAEVQVDGTGGARPRRALGDEGPSPAPATVVGMHDEEHEPRRSQAAGSLHGQHGGGVGVPEHLRVGPVAARLEIGGRQPFVRQCSRDEPGEPVRRERHAAR